MYESAMTSWYTLPVSTQGSASRKSLCLQVLQLSIARRNSLLPSRLVGMQLLNELLRTVQLCLLTYFTIQ